MNGFRDTILGWVTLIGSGIVAILGGPSAALSGLIVLIFCDLAANMIDRRVNKIPFSWDCGMRGLLKKTMYIVVLAAVVCIQGILSRPELSTYWLWYCMYLEAASILKHAGAAGIPIPNFIGQVIDQILDKLGILQDGRPKGPDQ